MAEERERFYSRLTTIPGIHPMPSIGDWILVQVSQPSELARKLNRRLSPGLVSVPRHIEGVVRLPVQEPKANEALYNVLREVVLGKHAHALVSESTTAEVG